MYIILYVNLYLCIVFMNSKSLTKYESWYNYYNRVLRKKRLLKVRSTKKYFSNIYNALVSIQ